MTEDNKKQSEPEELTSADVKQVPGGAELSADELQKVAGGGVKKAVVKAGDYPPPPPPPPPPPFPD
jgi:hypothetical protein